MYTLKKSLGQHFLKDENICRRIVEELTKCSPGNLLEVGPGGGALTKYLLQLPDVVFKAVELDEEKVAFLQKTYPALEGKLIHQSFLDIAKPFGEPFTVVGNFPYNISTQILFKILDWYKDVPCVVGMFQKEVAQRVAATHGNKIYGVTSVLVQAFYRVDYLFDVGENSFHPPPNVKSGVIRLTWRKENLKIKNRNAFSSLVKTAFNQRRKTLRNACKNLFTPEVLREEIFNRRAEQLSLEEFALLSHRMKTEGADQETQS